MAPRSRTRSSPLMAAQPRLAPKIQAEGLFVHVRLCAAPIPRGCFSGTAVSSDTIACLEPRLLTPQIVRGRTCESREGGIQNTNHVGPRPCSSSPTSPRKRQPTVPCVSFWNHFEQLTSLPSVTVRPLHERNRKEWLETHFEQPRSDGGVT